MPSTSESLSGLSSMIFKTSVPNAWTNLWAKAGPMPLIRPEARYFSTPSAVAGGGGAQDLRL